MNLEELQKTFGADTVTFRKGPGEFTTVIIDNGAAEAEICLHGAHLMKFVPAGAVPVLWMSKSSWFEPADPRRRTDLLAVLRCGGGPGAAGPRLRPAFGVEPRGNRFL